MNSGSNASKITVIALAVAVLGVGSAGATHWGSQYADCANTVPAAAAGSYDIARLRTEGYATGSILGVDLDLVDRVTPNPVPDAFAPNRPAPVAQEMNVAGALVTLSFPGLANQFLLGGAPTTEVAESAFPVDLDAKAHAGAHTLSAIFNGRVTVWAPESFTCESTKLANTLWKFTISRVALDGYVTPLTDADDHYGEPWGTGVGVSVRAGDTSSA